MQEHLGNITPHSGNSLSVAELEVKMHANAKQQCPVNGEVPQECRVVRHNLHGIEELKNSNNDISSIPPIGMSVSLENQLSNDPHENNLIQNGHKVTTHVYGDAEACTPKDNGQNNTQAAESKSSGSGQTDAQRKASIDYQKSTNLKEAIEASVAERSDPVLFIPRMPEVIEQIPHPQEMEDGLGVSIISNQSQSTQQGKDVIESQNEDMEFLQVAAIMEVQQDVAKSNDQKPSVILKGEK